MGRAALMAIEAGEALVQLANGVGASALARGNVPSFELAARAVRLAAEGVFRLKDARDEDGQQAALRGALDDFATAHELVREAIQAEPSDLAAPSAPGA